MPENTVQLLSDGTVQKPACSMDQSVHFGSRLKGREFNPLLAADVCVTACTVYTTWRGFALRVCDAYGLLHSRVSPSLTLHHAGLCHQTLIGLLQNSVLIGESS